MRKIKVCSVCGFKIECDGEIGKCLKCGAEPSAFKELSDEDAKKVYDSDRTNDIHCELIALSMRINELCIEGLEINLDPGCKSIFGWLKDRAWDTKQLCRAELQAHIGKGKW